MKNNKDNFNEIDNENNFAAVNDISFERDKEN